MPARTTAGPYVSDTPGRFLGFPILHQAQRGTQARIFAAAQVAWITPAFLVEALTKNHRRENFSCGVEPLDRYFREQVTLDMRRRIATRFVAIERGSDAVAGFYTLAATIIALGSLPEALRKKLPRYPTVPAVRNAAPGSVEQFAALLKSDGARLTRIAKEANIKIE